MNTKTIYTPHKKAAYIPAPGEIILSELEFRGWSQIDLAKIMGRPHTKINDIIHARRDITIETAKDLESAFKGTSAKFWINLQTSYNLAKVKEVEKNKETQQRALLYSILPIGILQKKGHLPLTNDVQSLHRAACQFMGTSNLNEKTQLAVSFRTSDCVQIEKIHLAAWCKIVENRAKCIVPEMPIFHDSQLIACKDELLTYTISPDGISKVSSILQKYGIVFLIEKHLPKTGIDGVSFELDGHPVIALSLRYDKIDTFWFTLFHELAHCIKKDYHCSCDIDKEDEANKMAQEWLIPHKQLLQFLKQNPKLSLDVLQSQAYKMQRHISILLGQLKKLKKLKYHVGAKEHGKASLYLN